MASETITRNDLTAILDEVLPSVTNVSDILSNINSVILATFYPVGSYYETSDTSFDPNTSWGGTWVLETEGQVHISAGTNYAISGATTDTTDGGETTHTLTTSEMPNHNHNHLYTESGYWTPENGNPLYGLFLYNTSPQTGNYKPAGTDWGSTDSNAMHRADLVTGYTGDSGAHNNMQPYIIVNRWHRTA